MNALKRYLIFGQIFVLYIQFSIGCGGRHSDDKLRKKVEPIEKWLKGDHPKNSDVTKSIEKSLKYLEKKCGKEVASCTNDAAFVYNAYFELETNEMASSIADTNFKKLAKIISPEMAFRGYLNSLTNDIALVDIHNEKIDLEIEINLMLSISTARQLDEKIRSKYLVHIMRFVVNAFAKNRIQFKNIRREFEKFMKHNNIPTRLNDTMNYLSPSFTRFPKDVRAEKNTLTTDHNLEYYENIMFVITGFAFIGNKDIAPNYTPDLINTENVTKLFLIILHAYILYGTHMNLMMFDAFSAVLRNYQHHENNLHSKLNLFDSALLLQKFGNRFALNGFERKLDTYKYEKNLCTLFLKGHLKMNSMNEIMASKFYKDYRLALNDLRNAISAIETRYEVEKTKFHILQNVEFVAKANREYLENQINILKSIAGRLKRTDTKVALIEIDWQLKKVHNVLMEMNVEDLTWLDYVDVMKFYLLLTVPPSSYGGCINNAPDNKIMNTYKDEVIQKWPKFNQLMNEALDKANQNANGVYNVIFNPKQISVTNVDWLVFENAFNTREGSIENNMLIFLLAHIYPTQINSLIRKMVDTARMSKGTFVLEQVLKAAILCSKTPALDEKLITDIANFYTEFMVYYHVTLESDLDTKVIDNLFSEFYIEHQHVIRSKQLKFYLEHPDYIDYKPIIFVSHKNRIDMCNRLMEKIEKNLGRPGNYFNRINTVLLKLVLMIRNRVPDVITSNEMKHIMKVYLDLHQLDNAFDWNDESFDIVFQNFHMKFKQHIALSLEDEQNMRKIETLGNASDCIFVNFLEKIFLLYLMSVNSRSVNRSAVRNDVKNILKLRQALIKRKYLSLVVQKSQQTFFEIHAVEIGEVMKINGINNTIYPDANPVVGFTTELAQLMVNSVAYQDRDRVQIENANSIKLTYSLLKIIYTSLLAGNDQIKLFDSTNANGMQSRVQTAIRSTLGAGDYILTRKWPMQKHESIEHSMKSYVLEFAKQFKI
ncbi:uncharacterized protein LOC116345245 [Contarinia nasturtii]|uniref:uncharacterized protein LOC116345245 n=1 Tax=Contarinia nasturtii TaxID=265458 RepID=UPI0012D49504|nr:uncharacterized protein LOC116345245 [Contarinia nasturtii]